MEVSTSLKTGTAAGTILSILPNLSSQDIVKTIILAAIGALVSFAITLIIKTLTKVRKRK